MTDIPMLQLAPGTGATLQKPRRPQGQGDGFATLMRAATPAQQRSQSEDRRPARTGVEADKAEVARADAGAEEAPLGAGQPEEQPRRQGAAQAQSTLALKSGPQERESPVPPTDVAVEVGDTAVVPGEDGARAKVSGAPRADMPETARIASGRVAAEVARGRVAAPGADMTADASVPAAAPETAVMEKAPGARTPRAAPSISEARMIMLAGAQPQDQGTPQSAASLQKASGWFTPQQPSGAAQPASEVAQRAIGTIPELKDMPQPAAAAAQQAKGSTHQASGWSPTLPAPPLPGLAGTDAVPASPAHPASGAGEVLTAKLPLRGDVVLADSAAAVRTDPATKSASAAALVANGTVPASAMPLAAGPQVATPDPKLTAASLRVEARAEAADRREVRAAVEEAIRQTAAVAPAAGPSTSAAIAPMAVAQKGQGATLAEKLTAVLPAGEVDEDGLKELALGGPGASSGPGHAAHATPQMPAHQLAQQAARQLAVSIVPLPDGPVQVSLSPEELGRVRLTVSVTDGVIAVNVQADRPETADLLRRHIDALAREFRDLGYEQSSFSFGQSQSGGGQGTGASRPGGGFAPVGEDEALGLVGAPTRSRMTATDGLDLRI